MNLIEKIARAFWEREYTSPWNEAPPEAKIDFRDHARIALKIVADDVRAGHWPVGTRAALVPEHIMNLLSATPPPIDEPEPEAELAPPAPPS